MSRRPIFDLVDRVLDGKLLTVLAEGRTSGDSYETIARNLAVNHDLPISAEQVRKWCIEHDITKPEEAA
jgi:hypothetical protein